MGLTSFRSVMFKKQVEEEKPKPVKTSPKPLEEKPKAKTSRKKIKG